MPALPTEDWKFPHGTDDVKEPSINQSKKPQKPRERKDGAEVDARVCPAARQAVDKQGFDGPELALSPPTPIDVSPGQIQCWARTLHPVESHDTYGTGVGPGLLCEAGSSSEAQKLVPNANDPSQLGGSREPDGGIRAGAWTPAGRDWLIVYPVRSIVVYRAGSNEPDAFATIDPLSQAATTDDRRSELGKVSEDGVVNCHLW
ncbi:hypothetical protein CPLU01_05188 [Colletotrichum plurivorum]|uniref:Uncharacterized protein n=1 Tax=Colletotrichum plurivorum TaxID=2175906 RepID=A0A8H6KMG8_9PEZI|nr:hypothetical protein CPLU01_05188 [Colletotrichum plurivorum]